MTRGVPVADCGCISNRPTKTDPRLRSPGKLSWRRPSQLTPHRRRWRFRTHRVGGPGGPEVARLVTLTRAAGTEVDVAHQGETVTGSPWWSSVERLAGEQLVADLIGLDVDAQAPAAVQQPEAEPVERRRQGAGRRRGCRRGRACRRTRRPRPARRRPARRGAGRRRCCPRDRADRRGRSRGSSRRRGRDARPRPRRSPGSTPTATSRAR